MQLGRMRDLVSIQYQKKTTTEDGGTTIDWVESAKAYAYIKPRSGLEQFVGMQIQDKITHDIRMRFRKDLVPHNKLVLTEGTTTRTFQIRAVLNQEERDKYVRIFAEEGVAV